MNRIMQFFRGNEVKNLYNFPTIDVSEIDQYPNLLKDIHDRKLDGIVVTGVFTDDEIRTMLEGINDIADQQRNPILGGDVFPKIFAQVVMQSFDTDEQRHQFLNQYFKTSAEINQNYEALIGLDFKKRIEGIFSKVSGDRSIKIPIGQDDIGQYANATIRRYFPEKGFISVHSGNYFQKEFDQFYTHLKEQVNVMNQLSYFVTINQAEKGGELTLFDLEWRDAQNKKNRVEDRFVERLDGTLADVQRKGSVKRQYVNPPAGSVLLFAGGEIWHRVEPIHGRKNRVTIAGFLGFSHDDQAVYYWS